jgi:CP family cyanate transporter-like MFS transporter
MNLEEAGGKPLTQKLLAQEPHMRRRFGHPGAFTPAFVLLGLLLVAFNLRAPLTGVGPLLNQIRASTGLTASAAGLLNTLPLLALGVFSLMAPRLGRALGMERAIFAAMVLLAVGIGLRSAPGIAFLFGGTLLLGMAIAVSNVMLPSLIKRDFSRRIGPLTGLYTVVMSLGSAFAAGLAVPVANVLPGGWRSSLACWIVAAVAASLVWWRLGRHSEASTPVVAGAVQQTSVWRSMLAWQVTLFMGIQAFNFYILVAWLPSILGDTGMSALHAGWMLTLVQISSLLASFGVPWISVRLPNHHPALALAVSLLCATGFAGLALFPSHPVVWMILCGLGLGGSLVLSLSFIAMRAVNAQQAAALSGMAQGVGYSIGAAGPLVCGLLQDWLQSWLSTLWMMVAMALVQAYAAYGAGRRRYIGQA